MRALKVSLGLFLSTAFFLGCGSSAPSIFQKPASAVVVTQWAVVNKGLPILAAFHYEAGDQWVFLTDVNPTVDVQVSVTLEDLLRTDDTLKELSDLPAGWKATRERKGGPWTRQKLM
jgi:hypothetical protein